MGYSPWDCQKSDMTKGLTYTLKLYKGKGLAQRCSGELDGSILVGKVLRTFEMVGLRAGCPQYLCPMSLLNNVDLPTLGLPKITTFFIALLYPTNPFNPSSPMPLEPACPYS